MDKKTILLKAYDCDSGREAIEAAGRILREGGIAAIPTETVYGLAGNALDPAATAKIYEAKGRPSDNPLIVHIAAWEELAPLVRRVPREAELLAAAFWPGPLTMILPKAPLVPDTTSGGLDTVAVRMPRDPVARGIIRAAGVPLAAPSANRSGSPSPTTWRHCVDDLWGRVDAIVESHDCQVGVESTVISLCPGPDGKTQPRLLRPGAVTLEQLREALGEVAVDRGVLERLPEGAVVHSPGMKYKHYAPAADVILVKGNSEGTPRPRGIRHVLRGGPAPGGGARPLLRGGGGPCRPGRPAVRPPPGAGSAGGEAGLCPRPPGGRGGAGGV